MPESYENEESEQPDVARYLDIARRRHMQFLIPLLLGFLSVWGFSWLLKPRYKSTTVILVEQPSMPKNYVLPNVSEDLQEQLASIAEQVMSRARLLALIEQYHLFPARQEAGLTPDQKVASMSKQIDVQLVHGDNGGNITAFSIGFTAGSPLLAQEITRQLADTVIHQNLEVRQRESENTTDFLDQQLQAASQNLAVQEAKVKAYEAAHEGALPSQQQSNLTIMGGLQQQLQAEQDALNSAVQQRAYYQTLIEQYRALRTPVAGSDGAPLNVEALDQTLEKEQAQLADLRSRYTENYPDVQSLEQQIRRTEKQRDEALAAARANRAKPDRDAGAADSAQNAPLVQLQGQLQANQVEIANRQQAIAQLKTRIDQIQGRLGAEPASEQELDELNRGYEQSQANYNDLLKKRDDSQMATSMEQMQQGERFSVLQPATLPWQPDFPNRLKFCALAIVAGVLFGLVSVVLFEFLDDRIYNDKDLKALLPVPVISEIPQIVSETDGRAAKRKSFLGWAAAAVVVITIMMGTAVSMLHP
jgi:polysaccharide chain length determinant protein (PEP-CTERM system associated)